MPIDFNLDETKLVGSEIDALLVDYDYLSSMFCLVFDKKLIKSIKTHIDTKQVCRMDQQIKAEVIFFTANYVLVMLKQHALGKLAYIPLFKSYVTQSRLQEVQKKLEIAEKNSQHKYNYFAIGTECKVNIKKIEDNLIFCLPEGKLKTSDTLPTINISQEPKVIKRKLKNDDRVKVIIQNNEELMNEDHIGDKVDFPWELNSFEKFYELMNPIESDHEVKDEPQLKKKKKLNDEFRTDKEIFEIEEKLCDPNREPQTPDDFERLLVSNPNNSLVWIKFIVFYLQSADLDKARQIAQKALKTINYRLEDEKLNVWVAYMNFENMYGNNESLHEVFQKAVQACDSLKVHQHLAEIYFRSNKIDEAREIYNIMTKKFKSEPEIWIKFAVFEYKTSNIDNARKLLVKSLTCLDKRHRK
jgi:tetratricopeptide (TPR) repeat protein